jgi:MacB-like periplasmic core domain
VGIALGSLTANKLRTLLTALGVIIGVAAVVALMAIGQGSQQSITASITANGANLLTVRPGASNTGGIGGQVGSAQTLTSADATALADVQNVPDAGLVSPAQSATCRATPSPSPLATGRPQRCSLLRAAPSPNSDGQLSDIKPGQQIVAFGTQNGNTFQASSIQIGGGQGGSSAQSQ